MFDKRLINLVIFLVVFSNMGLAQQLLSLEDCRNLAIENNKELKIASEQERVAYYEKKEALMNYFPKVSFSGNYLRNQKNLRLIDPSSIPTSINVPPINLPGISLPGQNVPIDDLREKLIEGTKVKIKNIWMAGFNVTQPVFMGGKIIALNDIRSYAEELATSMKDTKLTDVIVEVDNAYWQVVSIANKKQLADAYVDLLHKMEIDIIEMEMEGVATKADRLSVSVKLNEAEMTQTTANNGLSLSKMLLAQLCGLEINDQLSVVDESSVTIPIEEALITPTFTVDEALLNRNELKSLRLVNKMYNKQENIALAEFLPQLGVSLGYEWQSPNVFRGASSKFRGMWNVGVGLTVPLNFVSSSSKLKAAKAQTRIKQFELQDAEEKIVLQVNQEAYKLTEAGKKLISANKNTEKADENLMYANVGFEEGVIPASDALAAHTAWLQAHSEKIDAQIDMKLCKIYLDKALGRKIK